MHELERLAVAGWKFELVFRGLTNLENAVYAARLEQFESFAERQVLLLSGGRRGYPGEGGVHADVPLVAGKGPVDDPALHGLGDPVVSLLDPLEGDILGHCLGRNVQ